MPVIGKASNLAGKWTRGVQESFKFYAGYHIWVLSKAVFLQGFFRDPAKTGGHDDSTNLQGFFLRFLAEVNGLALADGHTDLAGFMGKMQTAARIDIIGCRYSLGIINVNRPRQIQPLVVIIHLVPWAVSSAQSAGSTVIRIDIAGALYDISFKITWFPLKG